MFVKYNEACGKSWKVLLGHKGEVGEASGEISSTTIIIASTTSPLWPSKTCQLTVIPHATLGLLCTYKHLFNYFKKTWQKIIVIGNLSIYMYINNYCI